MEIRKNRENNCLVVSIIGRLDSSTAPILESDLNELSKEKNLCLDFAELEYLSSAGLRVLLLFHKTISKQGNRMVIKNINEIVKEVFDNTGFSDILNIE